MCTFSVTSRPPFQMLVWRVCLRTLQQLPLEHGFSYWCRQSHGGPGAELLTVYPVLLPLCTHVNSDYRYSGETPKKVCKDPSQGSVFHCPSRTVTPGSFPPFHALRV